MKIDFKKLPGGLVPAVIQDAETSRVLIVGFMNKEALKKTKREGRITFYSPSRKKIFVHGESGGSQLAVHEILTDCDGDSVLIKALPSGRVCHLGSDTCFNEENKPDNFLFELEKIIQGRKEKPVKSSLTSRMFSRGVNKISQKVGEEAVEFIIEAIDDNPELLKLEAADLLYYFIVLLVAKDISLRDILEVLKKRRR